MCIVHFDLDFYFWMACYMNIILIQQSPRVLVITKIRLLIVNSDQFHKCQTQNKKAPTSL